MSKKRTAGKIKPPAVPIDQRHLKFCLGYLQTDHPRFPIAKCCDEFFSALFKEIIRYQAFTVDTFREPCSKDHRHYIVFQTTKETTGFQGIDPNQDEDIWTDSAWQFALPGQTNESTWRVYGFIDGDYFYIVWLDPLHALGSSTRT
jgi:hypothetical protein